MRSNYQSTSFRQLGAILVLPVALVLTGLGCSKANNVPGEEAMASQEFKIASQPMATVEVTPPQPATFSVVATGANLTYQWQRDGKNIPDAKDSEYTLTTTSFEDNGAVFKVIITDSTGQSITSEESILTVADPSGKPSVSNFTSAPDKTTNKGFVLSWTVTNADSVSIMPGVGKVTGNSVTVNPAANTTYTLTATNAQGNTTATTTVNVTGYDPNGGTDNGGVTPPNKYPFDADGPEIQRFTANTSSVNYSQGVVLSWEVNGATSLSIDNGIGRVMGNHVTVRPTQTTTYTLTASNRYGMNRSSITVHVGETDLPVIDDFSVSNGQIMPGETITLQWNVLNADSVYINHIGEVSPSGSMQVTPVAGTVYELIATNYAGTVNNTKEVEVMEDGNFDPNQNGCNTKPWKKCKKYKKHCHHYYYPSNPIENFFHSLGLRDQKK